MRRVILLQGPVGPFFGRLQTQLDACGWQTIRILFNSGDCAFAGTGQAVTFSESAQSWPDWFRGFASNFKADMILMFGDQRPLHLAAKTVADELGIPVLSFEEGYLRPDFITMELGGNNAKSPLRQFQPDGPPPSDLPTVRKMPHNGFRQTSAMALRYFVRMRLGILSFPSYFHHRQRPLIREGIYWCRNAIRKYRFRNTNLQEIHRIIEKLENRYFIVALQVHDDLQLTQHGEGWSLQRLIETSVATFSRSAPKDHHLVFKGHPLDRGHSSTRKFVERMAETYGVSERVVYIDDGSLGLLSRHSRGMVTINSTSAVVSFDHAKPVFAFGASFYESLTANGAMRTPEALERFWKLTPVFNHERWLSFRAEMIKNSQINGSFYIHDEMDRTCLNVIDRISALLPQKSA